MSGPGDHSRQSVRKGTLTNLLQAIPRKRNWTFMKTFLVLFTAFTISCLFFGRVNGV